MAVGKGGKMVKEHKTRVGKLLSKLGEKAAPLAKVALEVVSGVTGVKKLEDLSNMIGKSKELSESEKQLALEALEMDRQEIQSITDRWAADMSSDNSLSKSVRPLTLIYLTIFTTILIVLDSSITNFVVDPGWQELLKTLLLAVFVAYFGSRGFEKYTSIKNKK